MEEQKRPLRNEPGRRYTAGRVQPRGEGTSHSTDRTHTAAPAKTADTGSHKIIDGVAKPANKRRFSHAKPALPRPHRSLVLKRHLVERADQHRKQVRREHKKHFASMLVALIIISTLAVISWVFWDFLPVVKSVSIPFIGQHQQPATPDLTMHSASSSLDQNKPSEGEIQTYQAAVDAPRLLLIPKLEIEARVKRVGTSLTGEPISPSNIFDVGWYDDSSKPGQPGAMLINGHIAGSNKNGVFHDLSTLQPNDIIQIEHGDRTVLTYVVNKVQAYSGDQIDMGTALKSIVTDKHGLNLMTSSANYDGGTGQSGQRVIVFAVEK
jgi:sortase (surface protein transpeptidase)